MRLVDAEVEFQELCGEKKGGAANSYSGVYSLEPIYAFVYESDEVIHRELHSGKTLRGAKAI